MSGREEARVFERVVRRTCDAFGVCREDLLGTSRTYEFSRPRQVVGYVLVDRFGWGIVEVARAMQRDHSTISHAVKRTRRRLRADNRLLAAVDWIAEAVPVPVQEAHRHIDGDRALCDSVEALIARAASALVSLSRASAAMRAATEEAERALTAREAALDHRDALFGRGIAPYMRRPGAVA